MLFAQIKNFILKFNFNESETFNYVAGYNKLIIIHENNNALLILNPIDSIINHNYIIGIILKDMKEKNHNIELYKQLISSDLDLDNYNNELKNNIIIEESEEDNNCYYDIKKILENIRLYKKSILFIINKYSINNNNGINYKIFI